MPTKNFAPPATWNDRKKYFYRKYAGSSNQVLIDQLEKCLDVYYRRAPLAPPYAVGDIIDIFIVIKYILEYDREMDLDLAERQYQDLMREVEAAIASP
jgi:hypothetical protein